MKENLALQVDARCSSPTNEVCEFFVGKNRFLIVNLNMSENLGESSLISMLSFPNPTEIIRFEIKGQTCAILLEEHHEKEKDPDIIALLTERELQIATLVASGKVNKQIAKELQISEWTVSTHLRRIFAKLGVSSRAAMVYLCASLIC
jgi:DNA-binding CsgD family transcriptional regulator